MNFEEKFTLVVFLTILIVCIIASIIEDAESSIDYTMLQKGIIAETSCLYKDADLEKLMYSICCVVRNREERGMWHGLNALKRKDINQFVKKEVDYVKAVSGIRIDKLARRCVEEVFEKNGIDITNGADHYEYSEKYGLPSFMYNMKETMKLCGHTFRKEVL